MSEQTRQALNDAITAHIASEQPGELVTGMLVVASTVGMDAGLNGYRFEVWGKDQPAHVTRGLASLAMEWAMDSTSLNMYGNDD